MKAQDAYDTISCWQEFCKITVLKKIQELYRKAAVLKSYCTKFPGTDVQLY